jgi:hypothetical protein
VQLFGRRKGRRSVTLACPTAMLNLAGSAVTVVGFQFSHNRGVVDNNSGFQVNPGDSVEVDAEAPLFVSPLPGNTYGCIQWIETFDAAGGPVD